MSRGFPSMTALLGLLAIAGYQNRDKLAEMLSGSAPNHPAAPGQPQQGGWAVCSAILGAAALVVCSAAVWANWSSVSRRTAKVKWRTRGWDMAPTRRSPRPSLNRRLGQTCWRPCLSRPACRVRRSSPGFQGSFLGPSTSTPRTAGFRPRRSLGLLRFLTERLGLARSARMRQRTFRLSCRLLHCAGPGACSDVPCAHGGGGVGSRTAAHPAKEPRDWMRGFSIVRRGRT